ncbi:MAG: hypothetical protein JSR91_05455 [Proteobacteria bacterium]|nr:hypothetical protein [Pseudomonadota bacterium]
MICHDLSQWPLVLTVARGAMTVEDHAAFLAEWTRWLDRGERFATLRWFVDSEALAHPEGAGPAAKVWLQANAARLRAQVLGMATIVPPESLERVGRMNAEKLFGVPARSFGDFDQALRWMADALFAPNDLPLDQAAVRISLPLMASPRP